MVSLGFVKCLQSTSSESEEDTRDHVHVILHLDEVFGASAASTLCGHLLATSGWKFCKDLHQHIIKLDRIFQCA
jgi:hypothetical protein